MTPSRPVYVVRVRGEPHVGNVVHALRGWLKVGFGLRCISIEPEQAEAQAGGASPRRNIEEN
jgi:hypothetical protein